MNILVLGVGRQGKAAIYDLEKSPLVGRIVAADRDLPAVEDFVDRRGLTKVRTAKVDAEDEAQLNELFRQTAPVLVISLLPARLGLATAWAALKAKTNFVSTSYAGQINELDTEAKKRGVIILPEMGLDPGIDLVLGAMAAKQFDEVQGLYSYGTGIPEPACAGTNALQYKITWDFAGVLNAYDRPARLLKAGREVLIPADEIFQQENVHMVDIPGVGRMEAFANGDALQFIEAFGLAASLRHMGRFSLRWPGHCRFWHTLAAMGFLEQKPLKVADCQVSPRQFLMAHLSPRLQYGDDERDLVVLRIHAWGIVGDQQKSLICELIDYRDLSTGFFAMNRTVGFTASIAAQMILGGAISQPGVLSPIKHVPDQMLLSELSQRGIKIQQRWEE